MIDGIKHFYNEDFMVKDKPELKVQVQNVVLAIKDNIAIVIDDNNKLYSIPMDIGYEIAIGDTVPYEDLTLIEDGTELYKEVFKIYEK